MKMLTIFLIVVTFAMLTPYSSMASPQQIAHTRSADFSVPVIISEAKPVDFRGYNRTDGPVSFGMPLPDSYNITSVSQLGLQNASIGQFRVLKRYPDGHIWWVLVDTEVNITENGSAIVFLTNGTGNFGGEDIATENATYISVNTGVAQFRIRKNVSGGFDVIDSAALSTTDFVNGGAIEVVSNGTLYSSIYDHNYTATVEENGPVRACVKVVGNLYSSAGKMLMGYTLRMHFYKNKEYFKMYFTLRNAYYAQSVSAIPITRAGVVLNLSMGSTQYYTFARKNTTVSGALTSSQYLFQGYCATYYNSYPDNNIRDLITSYNGLDINGVHYDEYTQGWTEVRDATGKGITAAMRWMSVYWPAGFELSPGRLEVDSLSPRNPDTPRFGWGMWETRELLFQFHTAPVDNEKVLYELQYPLMGRALHFQWYRDTEAIFGQRALLTVAEEKEYLRAHGIEWRGIGNTSSVMRFRRFYVWHATGGLQSDPRFDDLLNYLRTGFGVLWDVGEQGAVYRANHAIMHSDGFDYKLMRPEYVNNTNSYNYNPYDDAHAFSTSMFLYYLLSGNEQIREAIKDYVQWWDYESSRSIYSAQNGGLNGDMRCFSRIYRFFALAHDMLQDNRTLAIMNNITYQLLRKRDTGGTDWGWSGTRGYLWMICNSNEPRHLRDFFEGKLFGDAIWQNIRVYERYDPNNPYLQDLKDRALGMAYFFLWEFSGGGADNHTYSIYSYALDESNSYADTVRPAIQGFQQVLAYEMTHDSQFLYTGWLHAMYYPDTYQAWERETQMLIYADMHKDEYENVSYIDPAGNGVVDLGSEHITDLGNGTYVLNWTVPVDSIVKYQIKFSSKPMVENLNFNQYNHTIYRDNTSIAPRSYMYSPDVYDTFWNALNIPVEPAPLSAGEEQRVSVNVSKIIEQYDERYGLSPGDPAYVEYNSSTVYHFAVKYWTRSALPLAIDTYSPLPTGFVGRQYSVNIRVSGGVPPYTWHVSNGTLPPGLELNSSSGVISGTPQVPGTYQFVVTVVDSSSQQISRVYTLEITEYVPEFSGFTAYILLVVLVCAIAGIKKSRNGRK